MAGRSDVGAIEAFIDDLGVGHLPHIVDGDGPLWAAFGVASQPAVVFISDDGSMSIHNGSISPEQLREKLEELRST